MKIQLVALMVTGLLQPVGCSVIVGNKLQDKAATDGSSQDGSRQDGGGHLQCGDPVPLTSTQPSSPEGFDLALDNRGAPHAVVINADQKLEYFRWQAEKNELLHEEIPIGVLRVDRVAIAIGTDDLVHVVFRPLADPTRVMHIVHEPGGWSEPWSMLPATEGGQPFMVESLDAVAQKSSLNVALAGNALWYLRASPKAIGREYKYEVCPGPSEPQEMTYVRLSTTEEDDVKERWIISSVYGIAPMGGGVSGWRIEKFRTLANACPLTRQELMIPTEAEGPPIPAVAAVDVRPDGLAHIALVAGAALRGDLVHGEWSGGGDSFQLDPVHEMVSAVSPSLAYAGEWPIMAFVTGAPANPDSRLVLAMKQETEWVTEDLARNVGETTRLAMGHGRVHVLFEHRGDEPGGPVSTAEAAYVCREQ